ncbi:MAG: 23S rRNA (uracil(1939)-C(5))-methyltransferase RlmD [Succinivibrionaceae bacterium]|nr:23S rRNA (uracil(1939)-C(5))-methyltransferase RlmD [Succinivibrionaceae bacterium]
MSLEVLTVVDVTSDGQGIAFDRKNRKIFIKNALLGEEVEVSFFGEKEKYAQADIVRVLKPSKSRIEPICKSRCGACSFKVWDYQKELDFKTQLTLDLFKDFSGFKEKFLGMFGAKNDSHYRNKAIYAVQFKDNKPIIGLYESNSHEIFEMENCYLEEPWMRKVLLVIKESLISILKENQDIPLRYIYLRGSDSSEKIVVLVAKSEFKAQATIVTALKNNGISNILLNINDSVGNRVLGDKFITLNGSADISYQLFDKTFKLNANSFLQINKAQTQVLYSKAIELLNPSLDESLADLYCGVGTISICVHDKIKSVFGIECVSDAIDYANQNKEINKASNTSFYVGLVEDVLPKLVANNSKVDIAILDPARKGCEESVFKVLSECQTKRIAYISCNPKSQVRDLKIAQKYGFKIEKFLFVDMFPRTGHVETVVLLSRDKA